MKITVLSHNLSSNASMRAHRLALAAQNFAEVTVLGPVEPHGLWPALPAEPWIHTVPEKRFPGFHRSFLDLVENATGDLLIAVKPQLASYGVALVERERRGVPVILDLDDLDIAFTPRALWSERPSMADLRRPASAIYTSLLTRAFGAASAITVASTALKERFGGTLIPHGTLTRLFDPSRINMAAARKRFGFNRPTVLFAGTPRHHKGLRTLAKAVARVSRADLAVLCREQDLPSSEWGDYPIRRLPLVPFNELPLVLAAADVLAVPQLDTEAARFQMPMKIYDCMAMGKPIVATTVSDLPRVLRGRAELVSPGDFKALAHAIRRLIKHPDRANALGQKARNHCLRHFSLTHVGARLERVVKRILRKHKTR